MQQIALPTAPRGGGGKCPDLSMEEWYSSFRLNVEDGLGIDTCFAKVLRTRFIPPAKLFTNGEEVAYCRVLCFGRSSYICIERTQAVPGKNFLSFFCEEEFNKRFSHFAGPVLIN